MANFILTHLEEEFYKKNISTMKDAFLTFINSDEFSLDKVDEVRDATKDQYVEDNYGENPLVLASDEYEENDIIYKLNFIPKKLSSKMGIHYVFEPVRAARPAYDDYQFKHNNKLYGLVISHDPEDFGYSACSSEKDYYLHCYLSEYRRFYAESDVKFSLSFTYDPRKKRFVSIFDFRYENLAKPRVIRSSAYVKRTQN